jgi:glyoxylase-like metal-dependent hydrolase (beta-lactamase superfamily II)
MSPERPFSVPSGAELGAPEEMGNEKMIEEILPRLHRVVIPLTGNPLREINSYVLTSNDRNLIIDTGMNRPDCREVLETGLDEIGVDLERTDFIATHLHADHAALIPTLLRSGSRAFMGALDAALMNSGFAHWLEDNPVAEYAARSGFPAGELQASLQNHPGNKFGPSTTVDYVSLDGGEVFEVGDYRLEIVPTPGHTNGHISVYEPHKKLFFSGDHVLGDITPNIQAWTDEHDPLAVYLSSLEKVDELDVELCLPGHRSLIEDFGKRIAELVEHHRERANEVISILTRGPKTAYQTASEMSWDIVASSWSDFPIMQRWFATGEAIAHLRYVEGKGLIQRELVDGKTLYSSDGGSML